MLLLSLGDILSEAFIGIIMVLDIAIYNLINSAYKIFMAIASARLLSSDVYYDIASRIYIVIGVVMLFVLSYAILKAIVDPDQATKGDLGPGMVKRVIIAVIGLAITPVLFNVLYQAQGLFLEQDVLGKVFFRIQNTEDVSGSIGDTSYSGNPDEQIKNIGGAVAATSIWSAFFHPAEGYDASTIESDPSEYITTIGTTALLCGLGLAASVGLGFLTLGLGFLAGGATVAICAASIDGQYDAYQDASAITNETITLEESYAIAAGGGGFDTFLLFIDNYVENDEIDYFWGVSTLCGAFALYAFASFSIDMGVRAAKLAYYQIIAPVPLIMQVLPGKGEQTFKEYTRGVIHTFLEVFIRIAVVYIVVYIICHLQDLFSSVDALWGNQELSGPEVMLAMAFLIIGLIIFCKDAPKFLSKTLGIDGGNLDLGIRNKLAKGGAFTAASAIGGGVTAGVNNLTNKWKNADNWKNKHGHVTLGSITKNLIGGVGSAAAGTVSGGVRGGIAGKDAKRFGDVKGAASRGAQGAIRARDNREQYYEAYGKDNGGVFGVIEHRLEDKVSGVMRWAGFDSAASLDAELKSLNELEKKADALKAAAKSQIEGDVNKNKTGKTYGVTARFDIAAYNAANGTRFAAGFGGGYSTTTLKDIRDHMLQAEKTGSSAGIDYAKWQDLYNNYLKNFGDEVQNRALLADRNYATLSSRDQADLAGVRSAALEFRTALGDNLGATVIAAANNAAGTQQINASNLATEDLIVNKDAHGRSSAISELGDQIKIVRTEVVRKQQDIRKKEETANGGGKPKP